MASGIAEKRGGEKKYKGYFQGSRAWGLCCSLIKSAERSYDWAQSSTQCHTWKRQRVPAGNSLCEAVWPVKIITLGFLCLMCQEGESHLCLWILHTWEQWRQYSVAHIRVKYSQKSSPYLFCLWRCDNLLLHLLGGWFLCYKKNSSSGSLTVQGL